MPNRSRSMHKGFTLIEVMVAVMIVSVVIAALLQMRGDTSHKFSKIKELIQTNQYSSFLLSQGDKYGFENSRINMNLLVEDFDLENDLRRKLKAMKIELKYEELESIDTSEYEESTSDEDINDDEQQKDTTGIIFEIGKTKIISKNVDIQLIRVRIQ
jgi:prepilin-type N-terminal cleavage/methylation domain-containing protein